MNISVSKIALGVTGTALLAVGMLDFSRGGKYVRSTLGLFDNPAIKWGALITATLSAIAGAIYMLATKDAIKRKAIEQGSVGFVVVNGKARRRRFGRHKGSLVVRTEGQAKNVIPKLFDVVEISWLVDPIVAENVMMMYRDEPLRFDLSIEYSFPALLDEHDEETKELLHKMVFGFRDLNRYNDTLGSVEEHIKLRCTEQLPAILAAVEPNSDGIPFINPDDIDWLKVLKFRNELALASLRVAPVNLFFPNRNKVDLT